jgi:hypothetical protein
MTHRSRRSSVRLIEPVVVTVVGTGYPIVELAAHLPARWRIRHLRAVAATVCPDAILVAQPTPEVVRRLHAGFPAAEIVAVVDSHAPVGDVVALLDAGAGACVREGRPALLAAHLRARIDRSQPAPLPA